MPPARSQTQTLGTPHWLWAPGLPKPRLRGEPQTPLRVAPPPPRTYSCCPQAERGAHGGTGRPGGGSGERELLPVFSCWAERKWPWGPGEGSLPRLHVDVGQGPGVSWPLVRGPIQGSCGEAPPSRCPRDPTVPLGADSRGEGLAAPGARQTRALSRVGEATASDRGGTARQRARNLHRLRALPREWASEEGQPCPGLWPDPGHLERIPSIWGIGHGKAWSYTSRTWPWAVGAAQPGQGDPRLVAAQPTHHAGSCHIPWARG